MKPVSQSKLNRELIKAAAKNDAGKVQTLIEQKADVNSVDKQGVSALAHAAEGRYTRIVKSLLEANADPNDGTNQQVLAIALAPPQPECCRRC